MTAKQIGVLSAAIAGDATGLPAYPVYALMIEFMAYTGLRTGEVASLEVGDLVFAPGPRCAVNVRRTKERKNGTWVVGTPKSKRSGRTVPLPPWLAARMAEYLAETHPRAYDWAEPVDMGTFYRRVFRPALLTAGLPASEPATPETNDTPARPATKGVRLHDLRHTFAAQQLTHGENPNAG